ncbi:hypothetical protein [Streptomyces luteocolor]|uniref:hypothetical protein n=1 Tax=Streptomyces luteocolor TaxID=285500 RepID=UPI000852F67F|nr:hypothetical protein [Streptomyces luteocolor]
MENQPTAAEIRLAQYAEAPTKWSTATYGSGAEKALHDIALGLKAEIDRLRGELAEGPQLAEEPSGGPRCGNNAHFQLSPADRQAVASFGAYLKARAEQRPLLARVAKLEASVLTASERRFLSFILDLAADRMASLGDEFDSADEAALEKLRRLASEAPENGARS